MGVYNRNEIIGALKKDLKKMKKASNKIDRLRDSGAFKVGEKSSVEIIREWRNKIKK